MTIRELSEKYYFHDSCIKAITYEETEKSLSVLMDYCLWAQKGYRAGERENTDIILRLNGVAKYDGLQGDIDYFSILDAEERNGDLYMMILDDYNNETYEYSISAESADVIVLDDDSNN